MPLLEALPFSHFLGYWNQYGTARLSAKENSSYVAEKQQVQVQMLDTHEALKNEKIGLIKIDVEGQEISALKGAKKLI